MTDNHNDLPLFKWKAPDRFQLIHLPMTHRLGKIRHCAENIRKFKSAKGFQHYMSKINEGLIFQQKKIGRPQAEIDEEIDAFWRAVFWKAGIKQPSNRDSEDLR